MELTTSWMREGIEIGVKQGEKQEALKIKDRLAVAQSSHRRDVSPSARAHKEIICRSTGKIERRLARLHRRERFDYVAG
jgi:hypothetical protein